MLRRRYQSTRSLRFARFRVLAISLRWGVTVVRFSSRYSAVAAANRFRRNGFFVVQWGK